jgi:hypothetical protein
MTELTTPPLSVSIGDVEARRIVNRILSGKTNSFGLVTLAANTTTTTLSDPRIGTNSVICLQAKTSNAAAAIASTYFSDPGAESVVINHANNAQTDRTFSYTIVG